MFWTLILGVNLTDVDVIVHFQPTILGLDWMSKLSIHTDLRVQIQADWILKSKKTDFGSSLLKRLINLRSLDHGASKEEWLLRILWYTMIRVINLFRILESNLKRNAPLVLKVSFARTSSPVTVRVALRILLLVRVSKILHTRSGFAIPLPPLRGYWILPPFILSSLVWTEFIVISNRDNWKASARVKAGKCILSQSELEAETHNGWKAREKLRNSFTIMIYYLSASDWLNLLQGSPN